MSSVKARSRDSIGRFIRFKMRGAGACGVASPAPTVVTGSTTPATTTNAPPIHARSIMTGLQVPIIQLLPAV